MIEDHGDVGCRIHIFRIGNRKDLTDFQTFNGHEIQFDVFFRRSAIKRGGRCGKDSSVI